MLVDSLHTNSYTVHGTLILTADNSAFMIMKLDRGCLLLLGT
jgi:hypothetical protein